MERPVKKGFLSLTLELAKTSAEVNKGRVLETQVRLIEVSKVFFICVFSQG
jgi:hypothetical protein